MNLKAKTSPPYMFYQFFIAFRHLRSGKKGFFVSFGTLISVLGIGLGVMALIVVLSLLNGYRDDLQDKILGANAHAIVLKYGQDFSEYRPLMDKINTVPGVKGATPFILEEGMIGSSIKHAGVMIKGVDPGTTGQVTQLERSLIKGKLSFLDNPAHLNLFLRKEDPKNWPADMELQKIPGVIIGIRLAEKLKVDLGDLVTLTSPKGKKRLTALSAVKSVSFRVAGIFKYGMYEYDTKIVYLDLTNAQNFFHLPKTVTGIELKLADIYQSKQICNQVLEKLDNFPYRTRDWAQLNRNLFSALRLQKIVLSIILTFIILVASFSIISSLTMIVMEKEREISMLISLGATRGGVLRIFIYEGLVIGIIGTVLGNICGLLLCFIISNYGISLDEEIYFLASLNTKTKPLEVAAVSLAAVLISFLATIYPARQAASVNPVEGLRL